jgi:hypothetical protein
MDGRVHGRTGGELKDAAVISMKGMVLQKRLFPVAAVVVALMTVVVLRDTWPANKVLLPAVIFVTIVGDILIGLRLMRQADQVIDAGDHLLITKNDQEVRVALRDVTTVSPGPWGVTLHVPPSEPFGSTITFSPQRALGRGAVVMSLRSRIQAAKRA